MDSLIVLLIVTTAVPLLTVGLVVWSCRVAPPIKRSTYSILDFMRIAAARFEGLADALRRMERSGKATAQDIRRSNAEEAVSDYQPKHMIDKEVILDRWQAQCKSAASILHPDVHRWEGNDNQTWALLDCLSEGRELLGIMYDYATDDDYVPKHLTSLPPAPPAPHSKNKSRPARRCDCGNLVGSYGNGRCGPSGCINRPA
jgi:hypothetical protein